MFITKRKSESMHNRCKSSGDVSLLTAAGNGQQAGLSKSGGIEKPPPPPSENKPKRPLSLSISDLPPITPTRNSSPPCFGLNSNGGGRKPSSDSISLTFTTPTKPSSALSTATASPSTPTQPPSTLISSPSTASNPTSPPQTSTYKMPPKTGSQIYSVIYDKTNSGIEEIDQEELFSRISLQRLLLGRNKLTSIPERVGELDRLNTIDLSYNRLTELPVSLSNLNELTTLILSGNKFMIPANPENEAIYNKHQQQQQQHQGDNSEQTAANTSNNRLSTMVQLNVNNYLPWELCYNTNLKKLDLGSNQSRDDTWEGENFLPLGIFWYAQLETLILSFCQLKSICQDIQHLEALTFLDISNNCLQELPKELGSLSNLSTLLAFHNEIKSIPDELCSLSESLISLDLSNNQISTLPSDLCYFIYLENLNLSNNLIKEIPNSWFSINNNNNDSEEEQQQQYGLFSLKTLKFRNNQLVAIPDSIFSTSTSLVTIDFSVNQIESLPTENIQYLEKLVTLLLFNNFLTSIPEQLFEINGGGSLSTLNVSGNRLTCLPSTIWSCESLSILSIGYNNIEEIKFPNSTCFQSLEELYCNGNIGIELKCDISSDIESCAIEFPYLRELGLGSCQLRSIPSFIKEIKSLEKLDLSNNQIESIPDWIGTLEHLLVLDLSYNSIESPLSNNGIFEHLKNLVILNLAMASQSQDIGVGDPLFEQLKDTTIFTNPNPSTLSLPMFYNHHSVTKTPSSRFDISYADMIGRRPTMEDSLSIFGKFNDQDDFDLISLFDGHAGPQTAHYSSEWFPKITKILIDKYPSLPALQWLKQAYQEISRQFKSYVLNEKPDLKYCGATAASLLIHQDSFCVSNIGDTRIVLCRDGVAKRLSFDHKPSDPLETKRISKLGGFVVSNQHTSRVNGTLAVSRSIGDIYMEPYVIPDPYLSITQRDKEQDEFIIVACDGLWDEISDQQACDIVKSSKSTHEAVVKLKDYAYFSGSDDNITVILIKLK
ncbi:hypothetical protein CYY_001821 [Polysphondylium violaceum]|uniref:PPM-type phosphatase domain-containing protein n=1 Tax=Polysphondylium violaceum TaxID=133409 RepID=A0A8J4Q2K1_9MYCE|nr:hypothetical protein CYY_001821 [Polysphondylium violaceum]